ncbi:MAG: hypothetical protein ACFCUJ_09895 [Thiotrichales bacterium]
MKITLTSQEYRLLLDLLYLSDWVMHAHDVEDSTETAPHRMLTQKLYSYAIEAGCAELIEADKVSNEYFPTRAYEDHSVAQSLIDRYNEDTFWDELTERLTERDVADESDDGAPMPSIEEYYRVSAPIRELYEEEFALNGIERLRIVEP